VVLLVIPSILLGILLELAVVYVAVTVINDLVNTSLGLRGHVVDVAIGLVELIYEFMILALLIVGASTCVERWLVLTPLTTESLVTLVIRSFFATTRVVVRSASSKVLAIKVIKVALTISLLVLLPSWNHVGSVVSATNVHIISLGNAHTCLLLHKMSVRVLLHLDAWLTWLSLNMRQIGV